MDFLDDCHRHSHHNTVFFKRCGVDDDFMYVDEVAHTFGNLSDMLSFQSDEFFLVRFYNYLDLHDLNFGDLVVHLVSLAPP